MGLPKIAQGQVQGTSWPNTRKAWQDTRIEKICCEPRLDCTFLEAWNAKHDKSH